MTRREFLRWCTPMLERTAALLYPRRCPFCGAVLACGGLCSACAPVIKPLQHDPPRLPETEHSFYALGGAASAFYYEDQVRAAILNCKMYGDPWYARELADLTAVRVFGAQPATVAGGRPQYENLTGIMPYTLVVPVPPRVSKKGEFRMPWAMAQRLGVLLDIPTAQPLHTTRPLQPQKTLDREQRMQNTRGAYAVRPGMNVEGQRVLLVDDVITTGATASACAFALMQAGALEVFAVSVAADEERKKKAAQSPGKEKIEDETA